MENGYPMNWRPCDVAGRAESAFVAREEVQPGEVRDSHQDHAGTRDMDPGIRQDKHQAFMCFTVQMHSIILKGQRHRINIFWRSKHFNEYFLMVFKVFLKLFTTLYNDETFICFFEITH
jgi:hypothetical protein